jgi:hypothetical protein
MNEGSLNIKINQIIDIKKKRKWKWKRK